MAINEIRINGEIVPPGEAFDCKSDKDAERLLSLGAAEKPGQSQPKRKNPDDEPPPAA